MRRAKSRRGLATAFVVIVAVAIAVYWLAGGLMDWLRVTIHGR